MASEPRRNDRSSNPSHISAYCLTYEEDTEYFLRMSRGEYQPDESLDADLFEMTIDTLEDAGFCQYRDFELFKAGPRMPAQSRLLAWRGLSGAGSKRVFHCGP